MENNPSLEYRVASAVHTRFDALPRRCKPTIHPNRKREWTPLCGIVLVYGEDTPNESLTCVAVATGAKCLSMSQVPKYQGLALHDGHAEILALRAFNRWVLEECKSMLLCSVKNQSQDGQSKGTCEPPCEAAFPHGGNETEASRSRQSRFLRWRQGHSVEGCSDGPETYVPSDTWPPFEIRDDVDIWIYCTCAPCGDASMELCMDSQEDPTPWEIPDKNDDANDASDPTKQLLNGRGYFSILGAVRRKPSRADAEPTLSKSCSDKLAATQATSLLSFPASLLVAPTENAYLKALLLPEDEISRVACDRCFGCGDTGRLKLLRGKVWSADSCPTLKYAFRPFTVRSMPTEIVNSLWAFGKPKDPAAAKDYKPSNLSSIWTAAPPDLPSAQVPQKSPPASLNETLVNGVRQGFHISSPNGRKASAVSRARMWELLSEVLQLLSTRDNNYVPTEDPDHRKRKDVDGIESHSGALKAESTAQCLRKASTYASLKKIATEAGASQLRSQVLADVRKVLGNWVQNTRDEEWGLQVLDETKVRKAKDHGQSH